jgi:hypothetical protein
MTDRPFYEFQQGELFIDGRDIRSQFDRLPATVGIVSQVPSCSRYDRREHLLACPQVDLDRSKPLQTALGRGEGWRARRV